MIDNSNNEIRGGGVKRVRNNQSSLPGLSDAYCDELNAACELNHSCPVL